MPEVLTKHPETLLQVLESGGAECGSEHTPQILTQCPPAQFCSLPGGEICVYGLDQFDEMTQIERADLEQQVCTEFEAHLTPVDHHSLSTYSQAGSSHVPGLAAIAIFFALIVLWTARMLQSPRIRTPR